MEVTENRARPDPSSKYISGVVATPRDREIVVWYTRVKDTDSALAFATAENTQLLPVAVSAG